VPEGADRPQKQPLVIEDGGMLPGDHPIFSQGLIVSPNVAKRSSTASEPTPNLPPEATVRQEEERP
jgi:hypothetical protein